MRNALEAAMIKWHFARRIAQEDSRLRTRAGGTMTEKKATQETDSMQCRACGNEDRASEGYPCTDCGTFICLICSFRGVTLCTACAEKRGQPELAKPHRK
jgi:hypothetical protein